MNGIDRRRFLQLLVATSAGVALGPAAWQTAYGAPASPGVGPYGPLIGPDPNGLLLPAGFTSRVVATSDAPVAGTSFVWPRFPDGAAVFPLPDGGWIYAANSEVQGRGGGASALRFRPDGMIAAAYPILRGTTGNCSGGATPWGTWLSCEETYASSAEGEGQVWECDPTRAGQGVARPALGRFNHEAVAVDPVGRRLYLTEDRTDGRFYRFTPTTYPDLSAGTLEAAVVTPAGQVTWARVPDPAATTAMVRTQLPQATAFNRGEGCWFDSGFVYIATTGDNRVWVHDVAAQKLAILYDAADHTDPPVLGVDGVLVSSAHDLYIAEDGGSMQIVVLTSDRVVAPVVRYPANASSEMTGLAFDPSGQRLYFSSQRGPAPVGQGVTFELTGPFRRALPTREPDRSPAAVPLGTAAPSRMTATRGLPSGAESPGERSPVPSSAARPLGLVAAGMAASVWAALWHLRPSRKPSSDRDASILPHRDGR